MPVCHNGANLQEKIHLLYFVDICCIFREGGLESQQPGLQSTAQTGITSILSERYRNRGHRFGLRFNVICALYNYEYVTHKREKDAPQP